MAEVNEKSPRLKTERHQLMFRRLDGSLIYPGFTLLTWLRVGAVWHLVCMEPEAKAAQS